MKKFFFKSILISFLYLTIGLLINKPVLAKSCTCNDGTSGTCREINQLTGIACLDNEIPKQKCECGCTCDYSGAGMGVIIEEKCCIPTNTSCLGEGKPCSENADCCSKRCGIEQLISTKEVCLPPLTESSGETLKVIKPEGCDCGGNCCLEWEHGICVYPGGIQTALGCFPIEPSAMVSWLLRYGLMFGGLIAFLLMIYGAFLIITSSGDPEKLKKGQEILFSALAGLLLIIFSVFILRFIGVEILKIEGWG